MTKSDVIQRIAYSTVPEGSKLVEFTPPGFEGTDITLSRFTPGNMSGINIMTARLLSEHLIIAMANMDDTPDAALLRRLHEACITHTDNTVQALTIEALEEDLITDHRKMVATIAKIAKELGIEYEPPNDRFMQ